MAKLNGAFEKLKALGGSAISAIAKCIEDDGKHSPIKVEPDGLKKYSISAKIYNIPISIKVELLTDCEDTKIGYIRAYLDGYTNDQNELIPLPFFPERKGFQDFEIYVGRKDYDDGFRYWDSNEEDRYERATTIAGKIYQQIPLAVAGIKMRVPLD